MIVVDSSALMAIIFNEPEKDAFEGIVASEDRCVISAVNAHETLCVLRTRIGLAAVERFWLMLQDSQIEIVPFDEVQVRLSAEAFDRYGKGVNSRSKLNLGDCAAYALAKTLNSPLLFKGRDFSETDLTPAFRGR
jgi:ribonuclease VapC